MMGPWFHSDGPNHVGGAHWARAFTARHALGDPRVSSCGTR